MITGNLSFIFRLSESAWGIIHTQYLHKELRQITQMTQKASALMYNSFPTHEPCPVHMFKMQGWGDVGLKTNGGNK